MKQKGVKISGYYFRARNCILPETKKKEEELKGEKKKRVIDRRKDSRMFNT